MKNNPLVKLFGALWHYSEGNRKTVVLFWCMFVFNEATNLIIQPLLFSKIINSLQENAGVNDKNLSTLLGYLALTFCATVFFWVLHGPGRILERSNAFVARINYRKSLFAGVFSLPLGWHANHHSGDTLDKIEKGTNALYDFGSTTFVMVYSMTRFLVCFVVLAYYSYLAVSIALAMMLISGWITMRFDRVLIPQYRDLSHAENKISEHAFDSVSNISTIIILRAEKLVFSSLVAMVEKPYELFRKNAKLSECKWFLTSLCCRAMICFSLGVFFWQQNQSKTTMAIGMYYLLINYLEKVSDLFSRFCELYGESVIKRTKVMNSEELSKYFVPVSFLNHVLPKSWQRLDIKNLSFTHPGKEGDVHLDDISFSIMRGKKIALIGGSGCGKTTLLHVLAGWCKTKDVTLLVDGVQVEEGFDGICQAISLVPQHPDIFKTTILKNITFGKDYDDQTVRRYTDISCFTDVALGLPKGFESSTGEKGVNLSGGQKQRLALARALLAGQDKNIILLDEPTSNLDAVTENDVYRNIFKEFEGGTIISSVHRLHLLPLFDQVYLFDKGKIIAAGSLGDLIKNSSEFRVLWDMHRNYEEV